MIGCADGCSLGSAPTDLSPPLPRKAWLLAVAGLPGQERVWPRQVPVSDSLHSPRSMGTVAGLASERSGGWSPNGSHLSPTQLCQPSTPRTGHWTGEHTARADSWLLGTPKRFAANVGTDSHRQTRTGTEESASVASVPVFTRVSTYAERSHQYEAQPQALDRRRRGRGVSRGRLRNLRRPRRPGGQAPCGVASDPGQYPAGNAGVPWGEESGGRTMRRVSDPTLLCPCDEADCHEACPYCSGTICACLTCYTCTCLHEDDEFEDTRA